MDNSNIKNLSHNDLMLAFYETALYKHDIDNVYKKILWLKDYYNLKFDEGATLKDLWASLIDKYDWVSSETLIKDFLEELKQELVRLNCPLP
jgi:Mg2+/Co2+ transporter CorB